MLAYMKVELYDTKLYFYENVCLYIDAVTSCIQGPNIWSFFPQEQMSLSA